MKLSLVFFAALLSLESSAVPAPAGSCVADVRRRAALSVDAFARDQVVVIEGEAARGVVADIAAEVCRRIASSDAVAAGAIDEIVAVYFGDALDRGEPVQVGALVAEVIEGKSGLARIDRRTFGAVTVACTPRITAPVHIGSDNTGSCGDRFLVPVGKPQISVGTGAPRICRAAVLVSRGSSLACDCATARRSLACK